MTQPNTSWGTWSLRERACPNRGIPSFLCQRPIELARKETRSASQTEPGESLQNQVIAIPLAVMPNQSMPVNVPPQNPAENPPGVEVLIILGVTPIPAAVAHPGAASSLKPKCAKVGCQIETHMSACDMGVDQYMTMCNVCGDICVCFTGFPTNVTPCK